jgi:uncharacterized protein YjbI with pentapeptide repeats
VLPETFARMAQAQGWVENGPENMLIDRPASPERGQLLTVLLGAGLRDLQGLNFEGLDLSFAHMPNADVMLLNAHGARLSFADFSGSTISGSDMGGTMLENARFRGCTIQSSTFAAVTADRVQDPYRPEGAPYSTFLTGADFDGAYLVDTDFTGAEMLAVSFDGALLVRVDFSDASVAAASLRGAVLLDVVFAGANLKSTDLDGAYVFGEAFLADLAATAEPGSFLPDRYQLDPVSRADIMALNLVYVTLTEGNVDEISGGKPAFRVVRVQPFDG